jgi:hypothetical protein
MLVKDIDFTKDNTKLISVSPDYKYDYLIKSDSTGTQ